MDFNSALDIIIKDLGEAAKIIDDLKSYNGVPAFQVELAKAKCRSAAEIIALLKEMPFAQETVKAPDARREINVAHDSVQERQRQVTHEAVKETEAHKRPLVQDPIQASLATPTPEPEAARVSKSGELPDVADKSQPGSGADTFDFIAEAENEPSSMEDAPVPPKKETQKTVIEKPAEPKPKGGAAIFADRFKEVPGRVNEKVQALRPEEDFTSRLKQSPINNLADAIGVNDRFYFIREVFGGSNNNYREAIERLNSVSKVNEAIEIIHGYTGGETNQEAVSDLLALVKRKTGFDE